MIKILLNIKECEYCGTETTKPNLARHMRRSSVRNLYCTQFPKSSTKCQIDLSYHIAMNRRDAKPDVNFKFTLCSHEFPEFHAFRQHKNTKHGFCMKTIIVEHNKILNEVADANIKQALRS